MTKKKYSFKHYRRLQRERHMKKKELSTKNRKRYSPGCSSMSLKKQRFAVFMVNSHPWMINVIIWLVKFIPTNPRVCYPKNKFRALNIRSRYHKRPACLNQQDYKTPTETFSNQTWVGLLLPVANGLITGGYVTVKKESGLILMHEDIISHKGYLLTRTSMSFFVASRTGV